MYYPNDDEEVSGVISAPGDSGPDMTYDGFAQIAPEKKRSRMPLFLGLIIVCICAVAAVIFLDSPAYHYMRAENGLRDGDYGKAETEFKDAGDYKDAPARVENVIRSQKIIKLGRCEFGKWRGEPVTWRVLDVEDDRALLISENVVASRPYDGQPDEFRGVGPRWFYEKSEPTVAVTDVHEWLRDVFLDVAFSESEQRSILLSTISYFDEEEDLIYQDEWDTEFKLFLLSAGEAYEYFEDDADRLAMLKMAAEDVDILLRIREFASGFGQYWDYEEEAKGLKTLLGQWIFETWLLRTPGVNAAHITCVYSDGSVDEESPISSCGIGIRPAMYISLK